MKIKNLTKEQKSRFSEFVNKWKKIGLSTEPANRKEAEEGVNLAYKIAGLEPPKKIVWCGSPLSLGLKDQKLKIGDKVLDRILSSIRDSVGDRVGAVVGDGIFDDAWEIISAGVREIVNDNVWNRVWIIIWDSIRTSIRISIKDSAYGQNDAGWLSFYDYFKEVCGLKEETSKLDGLWKISKNAGWWIPYENICLISERYNFLSMDNRDRLHNEKGMALTYPDGWGIYAWHGVGVTEKIIMRPEEITREDILKEKNSEVSRVMAERLGWDEYIKRAGVILMDKWFDVNTSNHYELYDFENRSELMPKLLRTESPELNDGTRPYYIELVDPSLNSCQAARKWKFSKEDRSFLSPLECNENPELISDKEF